MRTLRLLIPLLALVAPVAFGDTLYRVEMVLLRQNGVPAVTSPYAAPHWSADVLRLGERDSRPTTLDERIEPLATNTDYSILLHRAWQQPVGAEPVTVAVSAGDEQFGRFPIEGTLSIAQARFVEVQARVRVNQLDGNGGVVQSELFEQDNRTVKHNQLIYLDGGHLAMLLKIAPVGARTAPAPAEQMLEP